MLYIFELVDVGIKILTKQKSFCPVIFDPRKMNSNFLEANFGYFRLSTARDDKNDENCPSSFLNFRPKKLLKSVLNLYK